MEAIILKLLDQLNSSVFTLVAILLVAFWAIYKLGGVVKTFEDVKDKHKEMDTNMSGIKDTLSSIKATTDLLYQAHLSTVKSQSPLSLTPKGATIAQALSLEQKISEHWTEIRRALETKNPSNPYDIQVAAMDIARECFEVVLSEQEKNDVKLYAYEAGMNLLEIFPIIGILIRDAFLKEKGIAVSDIDHHIPKPV